MKSTIHLLLALSLLTLVYSGYVFASEDNPPDIPCSENFAYSGTEDCWTLNMDDRCNNSATCLVQCFGIGETECKCGFLRPCKSEGRQFRLYSCRSGGGELCPGLTTCDFHPTNTEMRTVEVVAVCSGALCIIPGECSVVSYVEIREEEGTSCACRL